MTLTNPRAIYGLVTQATPTGTLVTQDNVIGQPQTTEALTGADVAYSFRCTLAPSADLVIDLTDQDTTGTTAWVAGDQQVETATAAGTISTAGNATCIITSGVITGSPVTVTFAVALSDTPTLWAAKCAAALNLNAAFIAHYTATSSGADIIATRIPTASAAATGTVGVFKANDATMNMALDNDTSAGITPAATSVSTTAGVVTTGAYLEDCDGNDWEGIAIPTISTIYGMLIEDTLADIGIVGGNEQIDMFAGQVLLRTSGALGFEDTSYTIDANATAVFTVTVIGSTT